MSTCTPRRTRDQSLLVLYDSREGARSAIAAFQRAGLDMGEVSVLAGPCAALGTKGGARVDRPTMEGPADDGERWLEPSDSAHLVVPGIGQLTVIGPLVERLAAALQGRVLGGAAGVLRAALVGIGVPDGCVLQHGLLLKEGAVLVLIRGSADPARHVPIQPELAEAALLAGRADGATSARASG